MLTDLIRHPILSTRFVWQRVRDIPTKGWPSLKLRRMEEEEDEFDRRYGVDTAKRVQVVTTNSPNFAHGHRYGALRESAIQWCLENGGLPYEETSFIDIGCGKGRVVIMAAGFPFRKVLGVEYGAELVDVCLKNLEKLGLTERCEVTVADAVDYKYPDGNLVAYFGDPFDGVVLERVLKSLAARRGRTRIAYCGPHHDVILKSGLAQEVVSGEGATIYDMAGKAN
jgi:SAM-dependent methyltransferase